MLAREYCTKAKIEDKPIILSSVMIPGLKEGQYKMSKSNPDSAIFMEDTVEDVKRKIKGAFCPPNLVEENPCIDFAYYFVFRITHQFFVERSEQNGGNKLYTHWEDVLQDFKSGTLWPGDLKNALTKALNELLDPVRQHFKDNSEAKQLLTTIKQYQADKAKQADK